MKSRIVLINKAEADRWITRANTFAKSLCPYSLALKQFNKLGSNDRKKIKMRFEESDSIRREKISENNRDAWLLGIMVDAHIIATEFDIDPLAVIMCLCAPCKSTDQVIIKK